MKTTNNRSGSHQASNGGGDDDNGSSGGRLAVKATAHYCSKMMAAQRERCRDEMVMVVVAKVSEQR